MEFNYWEVECLVANQRTDLNLVLLGLNFGIKFVLAE